MSVFLGEVVLKRVGGSTQGRRRPSRRGLTLMELVVVLAVLAAVAAIVTPLLPNLLRRAHKATDATQTSEVSKAIQTYQAAYMSYPDNFDLLTTGTSAAFPTYLPTDGGNPFGGFVTAATLSDDERAALARVGVQYVQPLASVTTGTNFHPTMNPYPNSFDITAPVANNQIDITSAAGANLNFAVISTTAFTSNPSFLQAARNADSTAKFVVFGLGPRSSIIGTMIQDAPTSVPQNKTFTPDTLYSRVGLVFKVSGVEVARTERARFIAAVALEDDELEATEKDIVGYYEVARDSRN